MLAVKDKKDAGEVNFSPAIPISIIHGVRNKLKSGEYPTEQIRCFCGADFNDDFPLNEIDRYGIPHRMVLCRQCGIIRANPRMTKEAYANFYKEEYRLIYDGLLNSKKKDIENLLHIMGGYTVYELVKYFDVPMDVVVDIGCHNAGMLASFAENGSKVYGVDAGVSTEHIRLDGATLINGNIDDVIAMGIKADVVLLNHVFEHFLDIEAEMGKILQIMKPDALLFVGLPGLYYWANDRLKMIQNAHTWQFTADTFTYVMNCLGFDEYHVDEAIASVWKYTGIKKDRDKKPTGELRNIVDFLKGEMGRIPTMRTINKFTVKERKNNIDAVLSYQHPDISTLIQTETAKDAVIIGGAPSVDNYIEKIKELQAEGAKVFAIERMYQWCHNNGITPDYCVVLDACDDVVDAFPKVYEKTKFLIATQSNPNVLPLLKGQDVYVFSTHQKGTNQQDLWYKYGYKRAAIINGGGSVTICALMLAYSLGIRKAHIFGFDCHTTNGYYANGITGSGVQHNIMEVTVDGRIFKSNAAYISFIQQFFILYGTAKLQGIADDVKIYGDSLVKAVSNIYE